jgi:type I restriction enzyme S subunit
MVLLKSLTEQNGLQTGPFGSQLKAEEYTEDGVPVIMPYNIYGGNISVKNIARVSEEKATKLSKHRLLSKDILFPRRGDLGRIATVSKDNVGWLCGSGCLRARFKSNVDAEYIHQYLQLISVRRWLETNALGQTMLNLNTEIIGNLPIFIVPVQEQVAIARLLSTWDHAIEKTERLITFKEKQFTWLINKLITKKERNRNWRTEKLEKLALIQKGEQLNVADMVDTGKYYALNGGIEQSGFTNNWNTHKNTITISEGGNSCGFVNFNIQKFWCGGHCYALNNVNNVVQAKYLYYYLKLHERLLMSLRVGSGLPNIQKKDLKNISVIFPSLIDQKKIAEILDKAQQEIDLLKKQLEAYRKQKCGLMQKLLTGHWRVKINTKKEER